ncbi:MAG: hypothetical protein A2Y07_11920 [Planctomycetes bacterium GWF2_50_10]|nr:MAG: hypothetical protein A2Y07_11920 [Planctomycetes bacterium GWF2_50_10]
MKKLTIDEYLEKVGLFAGDSYGKYFRSRFKDHRGTSELAMNVSPSMDELEQLRRAVAIMTPSEKENADKLTDEQVQRIAADAKTDAGMLAIFMNGYALECNRVS